MTYFFTFLFLVSSNITFARESIYDLRMKLYQKAYTDKKNMKDLSKNLKTSKKFANDIDLASLGLEEFYQEKKPKKSEKNRKIAIEKTPKEVYPLSRLNFDQLLYLNYKISQNKTNELNIRKEFQKNYESRNIPNLDGRYDTSFNREYNFKKRKFKKEMDQIVKNRSTTPEVFKNQTLKKIRKYFPFMPTK